MPNNFFTLYSFSYLQYSKINFYEYFLLRVIIFKSILFNCLQYLIQVFVEGDTARGTTTLLYLQLHISLYTGTVHVLRRVAGVHPTSLTID
jgi:hypothetical protein